MSVAKRLVAGGMRPEEYPRPAAPAAPARRVSCLDPAQGLRARNGDALPPLTLEMAATKMGALAEMARRASADAVAGGHATASDAALRMQMLETVAAMLRSGLTEQAREIEARRVSSQDDGGQLSLF